MPVTRITSVAVLGAGTMGAQIAAHFANAGVPALLLDLDARVAREGFERARKLKPDPLFGADVATLVSFGGFDTDLPRVAGADWIIEAVVERLDVKQALLARVDEVRRPGTFVSSNTSGISIRDIAAGRTADFRAHWLGTHFFNPPRYLHLLEVIPTADTDPVVVESIRTFADHRLGKGVVLAKDTPNFIANHVALHGVVRMLDVLERGEFTVEEIDAITGPALGRPKSATFRTLDIAGLDVLALVIRNLHDRLPAADRDAFRMPPLLERMVAAGLAGEKSRARLLQTRQAARRRERDTGHRSGDTRVPAADAGTAAVDRSGKVDRVHWRPHQDALPRPGPRWRVSPRHARADARVLREGDAGDRARHRRCRSRSAVGLWLGARAVRDARRHRRSRRRGRMAFRRWQRCAAAADAGGADRPSGANRLRSDPIAPAGPGLQILRTAKDRSAVVRRNPGASLVDLGDGVLAVEFHSKMNAIGGDTIQMLHAGVARPSATSRRSSSATRR